MPESQNKNLIAPPTEIVRVAGDASPDGAASEVHIDVAQPGFRLPSVVLATLGVLSVLLVAYFAYRLLPVVVLVFVSILFATAIEPLVNWLRRGPFNRSAGILVVYTSIFLLIGAVGYLTVPVLLSQIGELGTALPGALKEARKGVDSIQSGFVRQQATTFVDAADYVVGQFVHPAPTPRPTDPASPQAEETVATVTQTALGAAEVFFGIITLFVVAFYWLTERTLIKRSLMSWLPPRRANRVRRVWDDIEVKVGGWVRGQLTLMAMVGLVSAAGYFGIGIKYWPVMALVIGLCEAIPLVGPYIGTAPAVLVALTQPGNDGLPALLGTPDMGSVTRALLVVAFAMLLQTVEGNVLVPRVMKNSVGITPLTVLVSILAGASLGGLVGALLAVPIAGAIQVIVQDIKAARESEEKFEEVTEEAKETREEAGELVVAAPAGGGETRTEVKGTA
jgi:predicted PurR-regulated permease PerM